MELKDKVIDTIKKFQLINNGDKIVIGVSGGPDSMCLLTILKELREEFEFEIVVAHINHMIRKEAKDDENYVKDYCKNNNIEFYSKSIEVEKIANNEKKGTEETGRKVRYEFFEEVLKKTNSNKIAIAHNKNDKAETIIMNVLRGSGISGLKGIEPKKDGKYIRPLIECERCDIEEYCKEKKLEPRIDRTNFENIYTRNKIRNIVIPYIKEEFNPNIIETLIRLSDLIKQEDEYLNLQVKKTYNDICLGKNEKEIILDLKKFNKQEQVIKSRLLLYTITELMGSTEGVYKIHIEDLIKLCEKNIGNKFLMPNKNLKILVKSNKIFFQSKI
ncbi:MAG: tRNA lysidine(34) synthetase TilS [Clostridia bacterium]|nr:tRNA lysidine(34) synthetase TilS [Clostridia bacterium]